MAIKGHSVMCQTEMRNRLLETERKVILVIKVPKDMSHLCSSILGQKEIMNDVTGYLTGKISKQNSEGVT